MKRKHDWEFLRMNPAPNGEVIQVCECIECELRRYRHIKWNEPLQRWVVMRYRYRKGPKNEAQVQAQD